MFCLGSTQYVSNLSGGKVWHMSPHGGKKGWSSRRGSPEGWQSPAFLLSVYGEDALELQPGCQSEKNQAVCQRGWGGMVGGVF